MNMAVTPVLVTRPPKFTVAEVEKAGNDWGFNCGPGALCAILGMTPDELRPHLGDFEQKGYMNPTMMQETLGRLGRKFRRTYRGDQPGMDMPILQNGLVRVQWGGPWTKPGVPWAARYRQTHWVGVRLGMVFDVNAVSASGGWIRNYTWSSSLVPWLLKECCPKGDGSWWPTHAFEVEEVGR